MSEKKARLRRVFSRSRWPGLLAIILWIVINVPDWQSRIQFWLNAAKLMGGQVSSVAWIVSSPFFSTGLLVSGLAYLILVPEPERIVRPHPIWPILGWGVFLIAFLAFWSVLIAGYIAIRIPKAPDVNALVTSAAEVKSLEAQLAQLQRAMQPRIFTEDQRKALIAKLNTVPPGKTFNLLIEVIPSCNECMAFADDILGPWQGLAAWKVQGNTNFNLNPRLSGVVIGIDPANCSAEESKLISDALDDAHIRHNSPLYCLISEYQLALVACLWAPNRTISSL